MQFSFLKNTKNIKSIPTCTIDKKRRKIHVHFNGTCNLPHIDPFFLPEQYIIIQIRRPNIVIGLKNFITESTERRGHESLNL